MKKGFTMIELIFVIVILGILASVAIPRLAATREDAEISAAIANLRTLLSDTTSYYAAKGTFGADNTGKNSTIKWSEITNVPMKDPNEVITNDGVLVIDNQECIKFTLRGAANGDPAHFVIAKGKDPTGVCKQVQDAAPLQAYFNSKVNGKPSNRNGVGFMAIGSSTSIYDEQTTIPSSSS